MSSKLASIHSPGMCLTTRDVDQLCEEFSLLRVSEKFDIPQEMVDAIIDELSDDYTSLKSVGLVCRSWYPASRRNLFRDINLGYHGIVQRSVKLLEVLQRNPLLRSSVKTLKLINIDTGIDAPTSGSLDLGWMGLSPMAVSTVVNIFPLLTSLTDLEVEGFEASWLSFLPSFQAGIARLVSQTPSLKRLGLLFVEDFNQMHIFTTSPRLEEISLRHMCPNGLDQDVRADVASSLPVASRPLPPAEDEYRLRYLNVDASGEAWRSLIACARVSPKARYILFPKQVLISSSSWDSSMTSAWRDFLETGAPYVEHLYINLWCLEDMHRISDPNSHIMASSLFDFSQFENLRILLLIYTPQTVIPDALDLLPYFVDALDKASLSGNLLTLKCLSMVLTISSSEELASIADSSIWPRLAEIISRPPFEYLVSSGKIGVELMFEDKTISQEQWLAASRSIQERVGPTVFLRGTIFEETTVKLFESV